MRALNFSFRGRMLQQKTLIDVRCGILTSFKPCVRPCLRVTIARNHQGVTQWSPFVFYRFVMSSSSFFLGLVIQKSAITVTFLREILSQFNEKKNNLQTHRTAISTKMAVAFANIFLAKIKRQILDKGACLETLHRPHDISLVLQKICHQLVHWTSD